MNLHRTNFRTTELKPLLVTKLFQLSSQKMVARKWCRLCHTKRSCGKERRVPHCQTLTRTDRKLECTASLRTAQRFPSICSIVFFLNFQENYTIYRMNISGMERKALSCTEQCTDKIYFSYLMASCFCTSIYNKLIPIKVCIL
jgi:hypothetical protein